MTAVFITVFALFLAVTFVAWRRYLWASEKTSDETANKNPNVLTDVFGPDHLLNAPHQKDAQWLTEIFSRSAKKFPQLTALQVPHTGESLTFAELDARAEEIADAIAPHLNGADQVVAVAMSQDNWQIVATHLAILKAGGTLMFLDTTLPDALITHMLNDAQPVLVMTRGQAQFRDLPTLDVLNLPTSTTRRNPATWLDDPAERLATIFYTSGTTGVPRGVECPHAGYVNLAQSYADYFDLIPGMDATSLTSSLGYDGSISEMYSAWVSGCAVVLLTKDQIRSGPDLVPVLCEAEVTVLFCPPVLLTTLTSTPEVDLPYPICRYIVPAGEAFPNALVEPWTRNRRQIINTYGPTEASTDTSRQSLRPGEPITIGSPFPNVQYLILEIDGLDPLPRGEAGELCIGGVHVARGYRNLPEQTEKKFITHPEFGRLYRTGDKCMIDASKRVHFLGRIDAQLKVRGHRVEAQAVEDILQTQFSDIEAAVLDYQHDALVAFVSAPRVFGSEVAAVAPAPAEWADDVTAVLARQLPEPSVPSRIFLVKEFAMKPVSGKIDRKSLPDLSSLLRNGESENGNGSSNKLAIVDDEGELETPSEECREVLEICRTVFETPLGLDDEFALSGGHSIAIARLAQKLQAAGWSIGVRGLLSDCNTARKIANRPRILETPEVTPPRVINEQVRPTRDEAAAEVLSVRTFTALQILFALFQYSPAFVAFVLLLDKADNGLFFFRASLSEFLAGGLALYLLVLSVPFASLVWAMLIKSFIGGDIYNNKITPGVYPKWSKMHLRIWCIQRVESMVLVPLGALYRSAPLRAFVLRQLGATVGENLQCAQEAIFTGPLDLITIDNDVAIQTGAYVRTTRWSGQHVRVGPIHLESGCKIGMRAAIANNVTVGSGTWITPLTPILNDVGSNEVWEGAPARLTGRITALKRTAMASEYSSPIWLLESINVLMQIVVRLFLSVIPVALILWFVSSMILPSEMTVLEGGAVTTQGFLQLIWHLTLYAYITTWVTIVVTSVLACLFIRFTAASPGLYPSRGLKAALLMYRMHRMNGIQAQWTWTITGQYLRALAGMRFPRVGASECDIMYNVVPEVACADSMVFWSNGCYTNMLDYGAEHIKLRQLDMPENFFTGNNCVAEYGHYPSNFLLGVSTPASEIEFRRQMRSEVGPQITVAGNPPVRFASSTVDGDERKRLPSFPLFATRVVLNDILSIGMIPITTELVFAVLFILLSSVGETPFAGTLAAIVLTEFGVIVLCVAVKRIFVGHRWGSDHSTPFWSWRHFAYFFAQDCFFVWCREPFRFFAGTTVSNSILRWMGCKVGERTIVTEPLQCFDWNAVNFGKDCYIDGFLQFHTFENLALKVTTTSVQDGCTVNAGATLMGGAVIGPDSTLLPLSLVLKEMNLSTGAYEGSPAEPLSSTDAISLQAYDPPATTVATSGITAIVDNTDWLKTAAIILVLIDHVGYFFIDDGDWWSVFGRMAAPVFFFLIGYAHTRKIPPQWIMLGVILTVLESSNNDWSWVAPNILLSFVLIRLALPYAERLVDRRGWLGYLILVVGLVALLPFAGKVVDYGAEGWLWALLGFAQRRFADNRSSDDLSRYKVPLISVFICLVAAVAYVWGEQAEFKFSQKQLVTFILCACVLVLSLCLFARGPSRWQPPASWVPAVRFIGRHTLAIYAIELAAFEIIIKLIPELAP